MSGSVTAGRSQGGRPAEAAARNSQPYLPDVGVIGLVPDLWGTNWQPRQHVMTRLARYFHTLWVNPARGWRESLRSMPPRSWVADWEGSSTPGFAVYEPEVWLPRFYRPGFVARFTAQRRLARAWEILRRRGCRKSILYLWRPEFSDALGLIGHDVSCYHIDDEYTFSEVDQPINEPEARLISAVDQVFIHSPGLLEKKGSLNPHTLCVPNGVDYLAYATPREEPEDLKPISRPRIGYVGVVKKQINIPLLMALAKRHANWSFVLVGPRGYLGEHAPLLGELAALSNVHLLGRRPISQLPAYTQHMDVCVLSYLLNDYTRYIYPLKLHEYLASGRPVVGSPIRSLLDFGNVIRLASSVEEWSTALQDSLTPGASSPPEVEARRRVASNFDWGTLLRPVGQALCDRLGRPYRERFDEAFGAIAPKDA